MNYSKRYLFRIIAINVSILTSIFFAAFCNGQPSSHKLLLALSKADHTLAILDPVTLNIVARIPVGEDPHEVIASSDGTTAYVTIYGGGGLHELNVIDLVGQKPLANV